MHRGGCGGAGAPCWCSVGQEITQRLDQQRAEGGATFSASRHRLASAILEPPTTVE
jgi:hypothetical protein